MRVLTEAEIRLLVSPSEALSAVRGAFVALADGRAIMPPPIEMDFAHTHGDFHIKGAFIEGFPYCTFKLVGGFYENASRGLPVTSGLVGFFNAATGAVEAD